MTRRNAVPRGVIVFGLALALATAGLGVLVRGWQRAPVREVAVDGIALNLEQAVWVEDQMEHSKTYPVPPSMTPGLPGEGRNRLTIDLSLYNQAEAPRTYRAAEFSLVTEDGLSLAATADPAIVPTEPGQVLNTTLSFDLDTTADHGALWIAWRHAGRLIRFPIASAPKHEEGRSMTWPALVTQLPAGDQARGSVIFAQNGCASCHGDLSVRDSNTIGPHLGTIGRDGAGRIPGKPAPQYVYESILRPAEFIAPACKDGHPCESASASAMPEYASLLRPDDMADLVAYLTAQSGT